MTLTRQKELIYEESNNVRKAIRGLKIFSTKTTENGHISNENTSSSKKFPGIETLMVTTRQGNQGCNVYRGRLDGRDNRNGYHRK